MTGLLAKERIIAAPGYNRWRVPIASILIHLCIGSVYAWSIYNPHLTRINGVVTSAGDDWSLSEVVWVFTVAIVFLGLAAAFAGKWLEQVGPRMVGVVSACCWGGGYLIGAAGIMTHQLWLLYLGYGVIGGCGLGLGYVSPVSTLIRWFPDRRGMAAGMAIMGFGGGAMIGTPMKEYFIRLFYRAPEYLGTQSQVELVTEAGRRFSEVGGVLQEVVIVGSSEARDMTLPGPEGVYVVGSGATGVAEAFILIGLIYLTVMLIAAFSYRLPPQGWQPDRWQKPNEDTRSKLITTANVDIDQALRTPQFYQLWIVLCLNVTA
ncbi:MAG: MFS transporter, partial [Pseudomonadota bacterium]|nr:MFS transporter [Pseudomonadota bacterium]